MLNDQSSFSMSVDNVPINQFFQGTKIYSIPEFQRDYSWSDIQQDYFLQDLTNNIGKNYFFGTVILVQMDKKDGLEVYSLIDGQQRITTFVLFMEAMRDLINEARKDLNYTSKETPYDNLLIKNATKDFISGETYQKSVLFKNNLKTFFAAKIFKISCFGDSVEVDTLEKRLILKSYERFLDILSLEKITYTLRNFVKQSSHKAIEKELSNMDKQESTQDKLKAYVKILEKLTTQLLDMSSLVVITSKNKVLAQTIFKNLNSRGMSLNSVDLIKNDIFEVLNYKQEAGNVESTWSQILKYTSLSTNDKDYLDVSTPEEFFGVFWNLYTPMSKRSAETTQMYEYFSKNITVSKTSYIQLLKEFVYTARHYNSMLTVEKITPFMGKENYFSRDGHFETLIYIKFLQGYRQERSLILSFFIARDKNLLTDSEFQNVMRGATYFRILVRLSRHFMPLRFFDSFARSMMSAIKSDSKKEIRDVLNAYKNKLLELFETANNSYSLGKYFSYDYFINSLRLITYSHTFNKDNQFVKLILTSIELSLRNHKPMNNEFEKIYTAQVEHVIPLSNNVNSFSNLALISELEEKLINQKNHIEKDNKISAANFIDKKEIYKDSEFMLLRELSSLDIFDTSSLDSRCMELGQLLFNYAKKCIKNM